MSFISLNKRNGGCPVCNSSDGRCRQTDELILCMESQGDINGWHYLGQTKDGTWGQYKSDSGERRERSDYQPTPEPQGVKLPAKQRDAAIKSIIQQLPLHDIDRKDLTRRGLTPQQINDWGFVSISKDCRLDKPVNPDLAGIAIDGRHFCIHPLDAGYLVPLKDVQGDCVGFQLRVRKPVSGNKYKWLKSRKNKRRERAAVSHTAEFNELPLQHAIANPTQGQPLCLTEGIGKPLFTSLRFNINVIGASGGNFLASLKTLKHALDILKPSIIFLGADAGSRVNPHVLRNYRGLAIVLKQWGYDLLVADWGQGSDKSTPDIDELDAPNWELKSYENWDVAFSIPANKILRIDKNTDWKTKRIYNEHLAWKMARRYTPDITYKEDYCLSPAAPKEGEITAIKYHTGQGKSTKIKHWFNNELSHLGANKPGSRNSLEIQFANTSDFYHLKEDDGESQIKDSRSRLTFCIDSILKFDDEDFDGKVIVLDEIESVARHTLYGGTLKERQQQVIDKLKVALQRCHSTIISDGNLTDATCKWIEELSGKKLIKYYNKRIPKRPKCYFYNEIGKNFPKIMHQIKNEAFPWVMFDSQIDCEAADLDLRKYGRKPLRIDSKTINDPEQGKITKEFLANPDRFLLENEKTKAYDCILSSPTVESGLDCNYSKFSGVYLLAKHLEISTLTQMIIRARDITIPRHICCAEYVGFTDEDSALKSPFARTINRMYIDLMQESIEALGGNLGMEESAIIAILQKQINIAMNTPEQKLFNHYQSLKNYERANLRNCLIESLQDSGYEIEIVRIGKPVLTQFKQVKKEVKQATADDIAKAKELEETQYKALSKRQDLKWEDRCAVTKFRLMQQLPGIGTQWDSGLVYHLLFENKKLINQAEIRWMLNHPELAVKRAEKAWHGAAKHNRTFLGKFKTLLPLIKELNRLGVPELMDKLTSTHYNNDTPEVRELWQNWGRVQVTRTGIDRGASPIRLINRLAAKLGYESIEKRRTESTRDYILDDLLLDGYGEAVAGCVDERLSNELEEPRLGDDDWMEILQAKTLEPCQGKGCKDDKLTYEYINNNKVVCHLYNIDTEGDTAISDIKNVQATETEVEDAVKPAEPTPERLIFESLAGKILTDAQTGKPDVAVKRPHYTLWQTAKNALISRHDLQKGHFRLPTIEDVANWIREAIATRSQQQIKWLFDHFGGDGNCLMAKAIERYPEELIMIYEAYD